MINNYNNNENNHITIENFFDQYREKLKLKWVEGKQGKDRIIVSDHRIAVHKKNAILQSFVGHLNLIHPPQVQILGTIEIAYLNKLKPAYREDTVMQLFNGSPSCVIVVDNKKVPALIKQKSKQYEVPLFTSSYSSIKFMDDLHYGLTNEFADNITLHGVFMEIMAIGVLIMGRSGIGKSELALELIARGHRLVSDDAPLFSKIAPDIINGTCPKVLQDFLEVRGIGIINARELFGDGAIKKNKYLKLIIHLKQLGPKKLLELNRLEGSYKKNKILDMDIPEITIPISWGRNVAVMIECAARNHILRQDGYNASEVFMKRQQKLMSDESM